MKIKFHRLDKPLFKNGTQPYTTIGYWYWEPDPRFNKGTLHIEVLKMEDWRHELAVWLHEGIEVFWCWLRGITTAKCDEFDDWMEKEYAEGNYPPEFEGGCHPKCPYRFGHRLGIIMEYVVIYGTFASWRSYDQACGDILGYVPADAKTEAG